MQKILLTDLHRQYASIQLELDKAIHEVIAQKSFIRGPFVEKFEDNFARATGIRHVVGVGNGTDALFIALKILGVQPGDEVITAANSFIATSEAITMVGAKVVFADCDLYYGIDPVDVRRKITPATKAIIPVHLYGQPVDVEGILQLASEFNLHVVEDAAQSVLAEYQGVQTGNFGAFATFSFFPGKNLGAFGDAGALVSNNDDLFRKARMFANHGRINKYDHEFEGINSRMDGIQGAILDVKLKYLEDWTQRRRQIAAHYNNLLQLVPEVILPIERPGTRHVYHIFPIRVAGGRRDALLAFLREKGIEAGVHYPIALPNLQAYKHLNYCPEDFPNASRFAGELVSLPIFAELTAEEVEYIGEQIKNFFQKP
jgi:dTDP-4-amino-4,6-dideoxygalactose transaminase